MFRIGSAARGLIARGEVDPFAGLGYEVWPPKEIAAAWRRPYGRP